MRRAGPVLLLLAVVLTLACVAAVPASASPSTSRGAALEVPHRCGYEMLARQFNLTPSKVVLVEDDAANGTQTYEAVLRSNSGAYESIRIGVFYENLEDTTKYCTAEGAGASDMKGDTLTCTAEDVLTADKLSLLKTQIVPDAVQMHADRLKVQRLTSALRVPAFSGSGSPAVCSHFTVPSAHRTTGVSGYDFVLYVAAAPTDGYAYGWATACATLDNTGRPVVGVMNVNPRRIDNSPQTVRGVAHEMLHSLGFTTEFFQKAGVYATATVRQKSNAPVLTAPKVVAAAKAHYGCDDLTHMELEDATFPDGSSAGAHWKRRNAMDEIMSEMFDVSHGSYTAMTIGAMESLGFYQGDYAKAEVMAWGLGAGCKLLTDMCMNHGVPLNASMFCTDDSKEMCNFARDALGHCVTESHTLPDETATWAANYGLYTIDVTMDYCPYVIGTPSVTCFDGDWGYIQHSVFGASSRCLDTNEKPVCAAITCEESSYKVRFETGDAMACPPGSTVTIPDTDVVVTCPPLIQVCDQYVKLPDGHNAATRSACLWCALVAALCVVASVLV